MVKFLLTLFILSLIVRFVLPVVLRLVLSSFVKKQVRRYEQSFGQRVDSPFGPPPPADAGEVRVEYVPPQTKSPRREKEFKGGEYVDFEEVK